MVFSTYPLVALKVAVSPLVITSAQISVAATTMTEPLESLQKIWFGCCVRNKRSDQSFQKVATKLLLMGFKNFFYLLYFRSTIFCFEFWIPYWWYLWFVTFLSVEDSFSTPSHRSFNHLVRKLKYVSYLDIKKACKISVRTQANTWSFLICANPKLHYRELELLTSGHPFKVLVRRTKIFYVFLILSYTLKSSSQGYYR